MAKRIKNSAAEALRLAPKPAPAPRRIRADAQRNVDALLESAKAVFAVSGVDAPVREIATHAGVGLGTIYRHFPQRADLVAAVFRREVDACAAAGKPLAAKYPPGDALVRWLQRYAVFIATKRGLSAALHSGDPAFDSLPAYFEQHLGPTADALLEGAVKNGEIRDGVASNDLLRAIANLCGPDTEHNERMLALLIDGLKYGARKR